MSSDVAAGRESPATYGFDGALVKAHAETLGDLVALSSSVRADKNA
jgi:hypothetical protein